MEEKPFVQMLLVLRDQKVLHLHSQDLSQFPILSTNYTRFLIPCSFATCKYGANHSKACTSANVFFDTEVLYAYPNPFMTVFTAAARLKTLFFSLFLPLTKFFILEKKCSIFCSYTLWILLNQNHHYCSFFPEYSRE